jgi:hypothetical protein
MLLEASPSRVMSRKEPVGLSAAFLEAFLAAGFGDSVIGVETMFPSGDVFSSSAFLGAAFGAAFLVLEGCHQA